ncbi:hypothetical protein ACFLV7_00885 [Chloroflexota bacterium]
MEFELIVKGNPAEFAAMIDSFGIRLRIEKGENYPEFHARGDPRKFTSDTNKTSAHFSGPKNEKTGLGWITADKIPEDRTLLYVTAEDKNWEKLKGYWILIFKELQRLGWIDEDFKLKRTRRDAINRVALALYYLERNICRTRKSAATRANTTTETMKKYEFHPDVMNILDGLRENPADITSLKRQLQKIPKRKR